MSRASSSAKAAHAGAERPHRGRSTRHRLVVLAQDTADAVSAAGGLIFDRAGGGWTVEVYLDRPDICGAFDILGVPHAPLSDGFAELRTWPDALVVSAALHGDNRDVAILFAAASRRPQTEVALWGGDWPSDAGPQWGRVEHQLSTAATAFKPHAMAAADLLPRVDTVEEFRSGKRRFAVAAPLTAPA